MKGSNLNQYRASTQKVSDNLLAELSKEEINWRIVDLLGRELIVLAGDAKKEQVKQRQNYILSKYGEE